MSNPIAIFESLRDTYLRYLDSPFDLRYPDLVAERQQLLHVDGRLYRRPLIEPVPAYPAGQSAGLVTRRDGELSCRERGFGHQAALQGDRDVVLAPVQFGVAQRC